MVEYLVFNGEYPFEHRLGSVHVELQIDAEFPLEAKGRQDAMAMHQAKEVYGGNPVLMCIE